MKCYVNKWFEFFILCDWKKIVDKGVCVNKSIK